MGALTRTERLNVHKSLAIEKAGAEGKVPQAADRATWTLEVMGLLAFRTGTIAPVTCRAISPVGSGKPGWERRYQTPAARTIGSGCAR